MEKENIYYATGKRKNAIAKTWMKPGKGEIIINDRPVDEYFRVESAKIKLIQPLVLTNKLESYDVKVRVLGGGYAGQAGAIRHGITKALLLIDPDLRATLKKAGFCQARCKGKGKKKIRPERCKSAVSVFETLKYLFIN